MLVLVRSFSSTPNVSFSEEFSLLLLMRVLVRSSYYTADANFSEEFLLFS